MHEIRSHGDSLMVIHAFDQVKHVSELTGPLETTRWTDLDWKTRGYS